MTVHERLRKFDTDQWYRGEQNLGSQFSMVVKAGNWLAIRGQTGHDLEGDFHGLGDPAAQAEQAIRNLRILMAEAGAGFGDICKIRVWVTDRAFVEPVHRVLGKHLRGIHIVMNTAIVSGLARAYMNVEIDVHAVMDRG